MQKQIEITPEEIRAIRRQLRLSQVEAGERIGGGPRAFTKYEAGTIKPAASLIRLLRVLQTDSNLLAILQGHKPQPIPSGVASPFDVTGQDIAYLTERTFPKLLRRLLHAEALDNGLPEIGIHVASNVSVPDGGEDGRITWKDGPSCTRYLPSRLCQFQLKAGKISPSAAAKDVLAKNHTVKEMVHIVLEATGNYIMLCAHPYTKKQINEREASIRDALRRAGMVIEDGQVYFRDADQIAKWVNCYPAVATWLKEQTPAGTVHPFRSWNHWAGRTEHEQSPWVEDERLPSIRASLHDRIKEPRCFFRIVGPAGVGKSRLTLEALGSAIEDDEADRNLSDIVLYSVKSEARGKDIIKVIQDLADLGQRAVVVVDQCEPQTHRILVDIVSRQSSRLSLITIDDDIHDKSLGDGIFKINEAPLSVIEGIVDRLLPSLPPEDRRRLACFCQGFPEIALRACKSWNRKIPLAYATKIDLAEEFVLGPRPRERDLTLKAAELLAVFGLVRVEHPEGGSIEEIATLELGLSVEDLYAKIRDLASRGIVKQYGRNVALQPLPVALRLAERQWDHWLPDKWDYVLAGDLSQKLKVASARQLALLNTTETIGKVVKHVCRANGPLDGLTGISQPGHSEVLSALAEISPDIVANLIERSLGEADVASLMGDVRRHMVLALEKIAFPDATFEIGARLLLCLAVNENEPWANNATGCFKGLFPMILGKTEAGANKRLEMLEEAAKTNESAKRMVIVEALLEGTKTSRFSSPGGAEVHGSRQALQPWHPTTRGDAGKYVGRCVELLLELAQREDEASNKARVGLAQELSSLVEFGLIDTVENVVEKIVEVHGYWTEALKSLGRFIRYKTKESTNNVFARVRLLIGILELPKSLPSRVRLIVETEPWDYASDEELEPEVRCKRGDDAVQSLVRELVAEPLTLIELLPELSRGKYWGTAFGQGIAELAPEPVKWLEPIKKAISEAPDSERDYALFVGFLAGINVEEPELVEAIKKEVATSPELAPALPQICSRLGIERSDIPLVISAIKLTYLPSRYLRHWAIGEGLANLPARDLQRLFNVLLGADPESYQVGLMLMRKYSSEDQERLNGLRPQVLKAAESAGKWPLSAPNLMFHHDLEKVMLWILSKGREDDDARRVAMALTKSVIGIVIGGGDGQSFKSILGTLFVNFPEIAWPLIGQALISEDKKRFHDSFVLVFVDRKMDEEDPIILKLPEETLLAWCEAHPKKAPAVAAKLIPVLKKENPEADWKLHPLMQRLLDEFGDSEDMLNSIDYNIYTYSWTGSLVPYWKRYIGPLQKLHDYHPVAKVRIWARRNLDDINDRMKAASEKDQEQEAQRRVLNM